MEKQQFQELMKHKSKEAQDGLLIIYNKFPEATEFLEYIAKADIFFVDILDSINAYLSRFSTDRRIERKEDFLEVDINKFDYHISVDDSIIVDKFNSYINDNSNAHIESKEFSDPKDLLNYLFN